MSKEELEEIINSYNWIKVKKYYEITNPYDFESTQDMQAYDKLLEHHKNETEFLIKKCRELAKELLDKD